MRKTRTKGALQYEVLVQLVPNLEGVFRGPGGRALRSVGAQFPRGAEMGQLGFLGNNSAPRGATDPGVVSFDEEVCWLQVCFCERGDWLTDSRDITRQSRGRSKKFA